MIFGVGSMLRAYLHPRVTTSRAGTRFLGRRAVHFGFDRHKQRREAVLHRPPDDLLGDIVVVVTVDVADAHDGAPGQLGVAIAHGSRQAASEMISRQRVTA